MPDAKRREIFQGEPVKSFPNSGKYQSLTADKYSYHLPKHSHASAPVVYLFSARSLDLSGEDFRCSSPRLVSKVT